jgi:hypothetical protein
VLGAYTLSLSDLLLPVLAGVAAAVVLLGLARAAGPARGRGLLALGLAGAALIYLAFALAAGALPRGLALEAAGVAAFGAAAARGGRTGGGVAWLAAGWALHALWDWPLHAAGHRLGAYPPQWYPPFCASFDLLVAAAVTAGQAGVPARPARSAAA